MRIRPFWPYPHFVNTPLLSLNPAKETRFALAFFGRRNYLRLMQNYEILIHPDPRLKKKIAPMQEPIEGLEEIINRLFSTMYDAPGIGLAAPQVGLMERIFVMDAVREGDPDPFVMINPEIIWASEEKNIYEEGCLSIPDIYEEVTRPEAVKISYRDKNFTQKEVEFDGLYATCAQHELDHLNGKLFIDYLSPLKRQMITRKMQKLKREKAVG